MMPSFHTLKIFAATGAGGSVLGALTHDQVMTWCGTAIAVGSALITGLVAAYHQIRAARRDEDAKDRRQLLDETREMARSQYALEARIKEAEKKAVELARRIEQVRCRHPLPDGSARCGATHTMPASDLGRPHCEGS